MTRHVRRHTAAIAALAVASVLTGCGGTSDDTPKAAASASAPGSVSGAPAGSPSAGPGPDEAAEPPKPASMEKLAEVVGCEPEERGRTLDYRQGVCRTDSGQYVMLTFDTDKGQEDWLTYAQAYGGIYLVGKRWVLSAEPRAAMEEVRAELGGTIEETGAFGASPGASDGS